MGKDSCGRWSPPAVWQREGSRHAALQVRDGGQMTMAAYSQAPDATCETSRTSQLFLSLQFVQHAHLLCAAFGAGPSGNGHNSGLAAVSGSVAGQFIQAQNLDLQHRGHTDCDELCDDLSHRSSPTAREKSAMQTTPQPAARSARSAGSYFGDQPSSGHAASSWRICWGRFLSEWIDKKV